MTTLSAIRADAGTDSGGHSGAWSSIALVVLWSSGFVGAELGARAHAVPLTLLGWRFSVLSALLVAVWVVRRHPWPTWRAWRRQVVLGLLCQAAYLGLVFEGVNQGVPGGTAALIAALQPLLVGTVAGRLLGERSSWSTWLGMVIGLAGVALVVGGDLGSGDAPAWAYALPVGGMLCLGSGTVLERRIRPPEDLLETITMQSVVVAATMMGLALVFGEAAPPAGVGFWRTVAWLVVLASLGGYVMYVFVARTQGATVVSTLLYLTPPTTMLWLFLMFGDPVTAPGLLGLVVTSGGVLLVLRGRRRMRERPPVTTAELEGVGCSHD